MRILSKLFGDKNTEKQRDVQKEFEDMSESLEGEKK